MLETIRAGAPISRAEISRRAGISKPTVSIALQSLLYASLVREVDHDPGGRRYGALFFEPIPEAALVLGLDLGARFLRGALCDLRGDIRARQDVEVDGADVSEVLRAIEALKANLAEASRLDASLVDGVVLGVPGAVDEASRVHLAPRVPGLEGMQLGLELSERLGSPVTLENDINLAALGERWQGVARGVDDFVFLSVGTGLGAGLVLQGQLHRGAHGAAGEVDLVLAAQKHELDPSAGAIPTLAGRLAKDSGAGSRVRPPYSPPDVFASARRGDPLGRAVVAEEARRIALHIVPIAAVVDVSLIVLGGGVGANGDLLLEPVRAETRTLAAVSAAGRDLQPWRDRRPERRPLRRAHRRPRERLRRSGAVFRRIGAVTEHCRGVDPTGSTPRLAADLDEPEVLVERDPVRVPLVDAEVHAGDATHTEVVKQPLDEEPAESLAARPFLEIDVEVRRVGRGDLGRRPLGLVDEPDELVVRRPVAQARVPGAQSRPPRRFGPALEVRRVVRGQEVAGRALLVDQDELGPDPRAPGTARRRRGRAGQGRGRDRSRPCRRHPPIGRSDRHPAGHGDRPSRCAASSQRSAVSGSDGRLSSGLSVRPT